jgi:hypothetical protein
MNAFLEKDLIVEIKNLKEGVNVRFRATTK